MAMKVGDVMTRRVISVAPDGSIRDAVQLMLQNRISGLPVVDAAGHLVGMVTEGDFLRRAETGTQRKRPRWLELITGSGSLAGEYVRAHGRRIDEVMTADPVTISEDADLDQVVQLMEKHRIKRLPVVRDDKLVGIVSRANLLHALASLDREAPPPVLEDSEIRERVIAELDRQPWAPKNLIEVVVRNGVVDLWGVIVADNQREAAAVVAENIPGVKAVRNHLSWVEPVSGMVIAGPHEGERAPAS
jgi:CBS domain-containing protein